MNKWVENSFISFFDQDQGSAVDRVHLIASSKEFNKDLSRYSTDKLKR